MTEFENGSSVREAPSQERKMTKADLLDILSDVPDEATVELTVYQSDLDNSRSTEFQCIDGSLNRFYLLRIAREIASNEEGISLMVSTADRNEIEAKADEMLQSE